MSEHNAVVIKGRGQLQSSRVELNAQETDDPMIGWPLGRLQVLLSLREWVLGPLRFAKAAGAWARDVSSVSPGKKKVIQRKETTRDRDGTGAVRWAVEAFEV